MKLDMRKKQEKKETTKSTSLVSVVVPVAKDPNRSNLFTPFALQISVTLSINSVIGITFIVYQSSLFFTFVINTLGVLQLILPFISYRSDSMQYFIPIVSELFTLFY